MVLFVYGFAKLNGSQFTVLSSELDKPMGDVSGFWLTWHYFGFSPIFGTLVALVQITLGVLLCWRKTTLMAACGGLGVLATITLIDLAYGVDASATVMAAATTACLGFVVARHRADLVRVLWTDQHSTDAQGMREVIVRVIIQVAVLVAAFAGTYWIANENNRAPTPLDGAWEVRTGTYQPVGTVRPVERLYFEYNRAYLVVFRFGNHWIEHHFEVDPARRELRMWEQWLRKDTPLLFNGAYELTGDRLVITGTSDNNASPVRLELTRLRNR
ncbi:hypothetical protein [Lentzea sp.]|uniref:hypothetical protein n=1 Tax=Lentzea sp. TaxID=56099 RepID=UPI002C021788|nr:hypothetical protein [Lentzea sp.]HUQ56484.1 hypothetical protein [Lentzea sp.]